MSKVIVAGVAESALELNMGSSDRLVYSNYFVPVAVTASDGRTPLLPFYRKQQILEAGEADVMPLGQMREVLAELGYGDAWELNEMERALHRLQQTTSPIEGATPFHQEVSRPTVLDNQEFEFVSGLLRPDVGVVFLDRTRITPIGFALGEHLYAQGLAPGEEVLLEQKTFTKRQMTWEEQNEQEKQFDLELASTYSTELQEGLERQRSRSDSSGLNASHTGQYSSPANLPWGQITASHTIGAASSVTEADQQTARESVKDNQTASGKVSARYRTQHKTTFRVSTEQGFEATARRTIRNPNRTSAVTLHCFKVMQRLEMKQERYGARVCWAIHVKDPAGAFFGKVAAARKAILDAALTSLPAPPKEPPAPPPPTETTSTNRLTQVVTSPVIDANKWGFWGDQRAEYDADIDMPQGWSWDGDVANVKIRLDSQRPHSTISNWIVGRPYPVEGGKLRARVHIGAPVWVNGPRISFQVELTVYQDVTITDKAAQDTKYFDDLAIYRTAVKEWNDRRDAALIAARTRADDKEAELLASLSPINEMVGQIVEQSFPAAVRDEMSEIDYWQSLFDWERATFVSYPGWWSSTSMRDPLLDPSDFINASWAKLYLPVRLNREVDALRWIFGKSIATPLSMELEQAVADTVKQLEEYRLKVFGAAGELEELTVPCQPVGDLHKCIASWTELIPTDGTHLEVVQGVTSAADAVTAQEITDAADLRSALLAGERQSTNLKDKAETLMNKDAEVHVAIGVETPDA